MAALLTRAQLDAAEATRLTRSLRPFQWSVTFLAQAGRAHSVSRVLTPRPWASFRYPWCRYRARPAFSPEFRH